MIFKLPWLVLLLLILTLIFTGSAWTRVWNGVGLLGYLDELPLSISPWYLVISGVVWGVFGILAAMLIWSRRPYAPWVVMIGLIGYSLNFWIEQFFLMVSPLRQTNWLFLAGFNVVAILVVVLCFRHPRVISFYGGRHEQEIQQ